MSNLNLARKLRPKIFEEIIGQDLSVSMLKNSLYVKKLFPVYLFSGQRGCGKTSTARVFGCAVNCEKLPDFQSDAKQQIPCLACDSCKSMLKSNHPDFIEMDAASHTGVDSVRQIIESCTYMPLAGSKKIYLIDEAHMLSKAAFNAFLKILEEPPDSTIFILATTEIQKIPETVRSRCFQVIFNPIQNDVLFGHLQKICSQEAIHANEDALQLMVQENDGSVRDAINTLEQVRFCGEHITKELVLKSLGKLSDAQLFKLINFILDQNPKALLEHLQAIQFETLSAQALWNMVVQALRSLLWIKYGVGEHKKELGGLAKKCTVNRVHALLQMLWTQESLFLKTPQKHIFLETVLLQMCHQVNVKDLQTLLERCKNAPNQTPKTQPVIPKQTNSPWSSFLSEIEQICKDPLLTSIFKQAQFVEENEDKSKVTLKLLNNSSFFQEKIHETKDVWETPLKKHFPQFHSFTFLESSPPKSVKPPRAVNTGYSKPPYNQAVDISDKEKWPKANLLTQVFSGKIEKVSDK